MTTRQTTYYRLFVEGEDSDSIDMEKLLSSVPEDADFNIKHFTVETSVEAQDENTETSEQI